MTPTTTRLVQGLLIAALGGLVVGLPALNVATDGQATAVMVTASAEATDGGFHGLEWDSPELFVLCGQIDVSAPRAFAYCVADEFVETEPSHRDGLVQRGPPDC